MNDKRRDESKQRMDILDRFIKQTLHIKDNQGPKQDKNNSNKRHSFKTHKRKNNNKSSFKRAMKAGQHIKYDPKGKLRVIPIGGLDEVGKNTMLFEYEDSIIMIDLGFQFPEADMLGVDYVVPDIQYLKDKQKKIKGIVITHGHLDHIGAIPYVLPKLGYPPIYAGRLAKGLIEKQLEEHGLLDKATIRNFRLDDELQFGKMRVSFFGITHSIPDCCGVFIQTPAGSVVHTGDFKIDLSPAAGQNPVDFEKLGAISKRKPTLLMSDSTNSFKPGMSVSEKKIGETIEKIVASEKGRIIIASFASQIGRMQHVIDAAKKHGKTIFLSGRSLINNMYLGKDLGYLKVPDGLIKDIKKAKKHPPEKTVILTTGSQGEPVAALTRMALKEHAHVKIGPKDTVVLSSTPIPGNEMAVFRVINNLTRLGAKIIHNHIMDVHASGHGYQEDLKIMYSLVRPKYFAPIHGEYFMRKAHGDLMIREMDLPPQNMIMAENGSVVEINNGKARVVDENIQTNYILVDGLGGGDIGSQVMKDRQSLAENGVVIVNFLIDGKNGKMLHEPQVETRGFIYMEESEEILKGVVKRAKDTYLNFAGNGEKRGDEEIKIRIREAVDQYVVSKIDRKPLIIPMIAKV
ncbi:RNase J family beta-CASP ribonuclease [Candidatus Peregrinibacteria bacterium]|nr:RNase J family beta-CASP ribonuclease [Candidatus Peregrinibacteria bacterium]